MTEDELFEKGFHAQKQGCLEKAIFYFQQCLAINPNHIDSLHFIALSLAQNGNYHESIAWFEKALLLNPNAPIIHNNCANAYKKLHDWKNTISHYQKAIELKPNYAQAYNNLANVYDILNDLTRALKYYTKAIQLKPEMATFHLNLGVLLIKMNRLNAAKKQFKNVIELNPNAASAHFYLGSLNLEENNLKKAQEQFEIVLSINNEHVETLVNLGVIMLKMQNPQSAIDYFTKALVIDNEHLEARNNLAATFIHHDRYENALMHYDVLLKKEPKNIEYNFNSGVAQMALGHLGEATVHLETVLTSSPNHINSLKNLAAIYLRQEQTDKAISLFEQLKKLNENDNASDYMLSALKQNKQYQKSPTEYIINLFDNYAIQYDNHLLKHLNYHVPEEISDYLKKHITTNNAVSLDLGCGTGLMADILKPYSKILWGVDLAPKMIEASQKKGCYDKLFEQEVDSFLKEQTLMFDIIIAADLFPYYGNLSQIMLLIKQHLNRDGLFIFNTEINQKSDYQLQNNARFCHHIDYIKSLSESYNLELIHQHQFNARLQEGKPLKAMLYVLKLSFS
jgi:predicted TPR repeat methyltransferase